MADDFEVYLYKVTRIQNVHVGVVRVHLVYVQPRADKNMGGGRVLYLGSFSVCFQGYD